MSSSNVLEAANRAEVTALLMRSGYRVYRPEADTEGEDLILRTPDGLLIPVQQKGRVHVERGRYAGRGIWMLFPSAPFQPDRRRDWFLVEHDRLFAYLEQHHGQAPSWVHGKWTIRTPAQHLRAFLDPFTIRAAGEPRE